ncbi:hypothetical protein HJA86_10560 [Rhizobium bangladeshense]|nr:hypothetical protein [Rhizobium bangladeshense]
MIRFLARYFAAVRKTARDDLIAWGLLIAALLIVILLSNLQSLFANQVPALG